MTGQNGFSPNRAKTVPLRAFRPGRPDLAVLFSLAFPVVVVQVGTMLMGVVDTVMVGHVSPRDLAAVALGNLYFFGCTLVGMGVLYALDPLVSQALGAGDDEAVARSVQRSVILVVGLTVATSVVMAPAGAVLRLLRQPAEVVPTASAYVVATIAGALPFYAFVALRQTLQAMGRITPVIVAVVLGNVANVALNWVLVFGHLGAPALGAVGSGWASTLARWLMAFVLLGLGWPATRRYLWPPRAGVRAWAPLRATLALGLPIGAQFSLEFGAFAAIAVLMGWLSTTAMAGHQVAINLASLTFMVPLGIGQAAGVLVGRAVGRSDEAGARRAAGAGLLAGAAFMTGTALLFLTAPGPLAAQYTNDAEVLAVAVSLLPLAGLFQVFDGLQVVAAGVLRGVGDTRAPMIVNVVGFWICGMPISLWLGFRMGAGPVGLWWGLVAGLAAVAFFLLARIRRRFGGELKRLVLAGH
ncbi:MAG: MATE family efflux transporter [Gemmatimonadetes bacterium]|nr:MATE family efflux transporter [Gemmatimonadota bacterium]